MAAIQTITEPTADEQQQMVYNRRMRRSNSEELDTGQKFAICLIKLAGAVTQSDYPALKVAIEGVPGVQQISLLIDGQCPVAIPVGTAIRLYVDGHTRIDDKPVPE